MRQKNTSVRTIAIRVKTEHDHFVRNVFIGFKLSAVGRTVETRYTNDPLSMKNVPVRRRCEPYAVFSFLRVCSFLKPGKVGFYRKRKKQMEGKTNKRSDATFTNGGRDNNHRFFFFFFHFTVHENNMHVKSAPVTFKTPVVYNLYTYARLPDTYYIRRAVYLYYAGTQQLCTHTPGSHEQEKKKTNT